MSRRTTISTLSRSLRTGLAFAVFAVLSVSIALTALPFYRRISASAEDCELRTQHLISRCFGFFRQLLVRLGLARFVLVGAERLREPGVLVVANHPTLIDAVVIISCMPQADCVVGKEYWDSYMRGTMVGAGYIRNEGGLAIVQECARRLKRGRSLVLFPEGTRSPEGGLGAFQRGAAHVAIESGCDLLPVVVTCNPPTLMKGQKWYEVPDRRFEITIRVEEPIPVVDYVAPGVSRSLAARKLTAAMRELFEKRLDRAES